MARAVPKLCFLFNTNHFPGILYSVEKEWFTNKNRSANIILIRLRKVLDEKPCIDIPVPSSYGTVIYAILVKYKHKSNWYWMKIVSITASFQYGSYVDKRLPTIYVSNKDLYYVFIHIYYVISQSHQGSRFSYSRT